MDDLLLPYKFKWIGAALVFLGFAGLVFYLWFEFRLILPVFAVFSSFFETRIFTVFETNVADELILLSLLAGFFFLVFSREKVESGMMDQIRSKAIWRAILANTVLLFVSILFVFGNGFFGIIILNLFSVFTFYLIFFNYLKRKELRKQ